MVVQFSKKRKFVADGIFKAELNEVLIQELAEDSYSGVEVWVTPTRTEIITLATRTQNVLDEKVWQIRELTAVVQKRFGFSEGKVELYAEKVSTRDMCRCPGRVSVLQTPRRACCAEGLPMVCYGSSWRVGPKASRSLCLGNSEDRGLNSWSLWMAWWSIAGTLLILCWHHCAPCAAPTGCAGHQGEDHAALGTSW